MSSSRYAQYLQYVESVGRGCGFDVRVDRMRIPSTRRTCLVGTVPAGRSPAQWHSLAADAAKLLRVKIFCRSTYLFLEALVLTCFFWVSWYLVNLVFDFTLSTLLPLW